MSRNLISSSVLTAAFVITVFAPSGKAGIVYDNISASTGATSGGTAEITSADSGPLGDSFSTGATSSSLSDVQLLVDASAPADGGSFNVDLVSNAAGNTLGSLIGVLGTVPDSALPTSVSTPYDLPVSGPVLAPNTRYWIELISSNTSAEWSYDNTNVGIGVANEYNYYAGSSSANASFTPYQATISTSAVPEPTTMALGAAVTGLMTLGRRRRV